MSWGSKRGCDHCRGYWRGGGTTRRLVGKEKEEDGQRASGKAKDSNGQARHLHLTEQGPEGFECLGRSRDLLLFAFGAPIASRQGQFWLHHHARACAIKYLCPRHPLPKECLSYTLHQKAARFSCYESVSPISNRSRRDPLPICGKQNAGCAMVSAMAAIATALEDGQRNSMQRVWMASIRSVKNEKQSLIPLQALAPSSSHFRET